jgi:hypothetical protein
MITLVLGIAGGIILACLVLAHWEAILWVAIHLAWWSFVLGISVSILFLMIAVYQHWNEIKQYMNALYGFYLA